MRRSILFVLASLAVLLAGCGSTSSPARNATLVLDFTPNAVHAGIYSAIRRGFDRREGVRLHVIAPSASTDSIKLLETGRVDFAILDIHDLAIARERGADIVGIMAIVERPLASVIAAPAIRSPRALEGKVVGVTGAPSDTAVLDSVLAGAGADPGRVKTVTIGFNAVPSLLSGRVAAATAFWNDEGVTIEQRRPGFHIFKVDEYGAPPYPELVLCATGGVVRRDPGLARAVVRAVVRGYELTLTDPRASEADLRSLVPGLDPRLLDAELMALEPAFETRDRRFGALEPPTISAWAQWEVRFGIVRAVPNVARMFDARFVDGH